LGQVHAGSANEIYGMAHGYVILQGQFTEVSGEIMRKDIGLNYKETIKEDERKKHGWGIPR